MRSKYKPFELQHYPVVLKSLNSFRIMALLLTVAVWILQSFGNKRDSNPSPKPWG